MARQKKMQVGQMVELAQPRLGEKEWLPFLITQIYDDGRISGVCFSGEPGALGWMNRAAQAFDHVEFGNGMREYRVKGVQQMEDAPEAAPETESGPELDLQDGDAIDQEMVASDNVVDDDGKPFGEE